MKATSCPLLVAALLGLGCGSAGEVESHGVVETHDGGSPGVVETHDGGSPDGEEALEVEDQRIVLSPEAVVAAGIVVEPVTLRSVTPTIEVTGRLGYDERRMAVATARIGGRVTKVVADYGATVSAGEALAWIDSPELGAAQAEYRRAWSTARVREAEYERGQLLLEGQAISRGDLLRREAEWQAARAEVHAAGQTLHLLGLSGADVDALELATARPTTAYPVRATIAGRVTERRASVGQVVGSDTELFVIAELDALWLMVQLFEKDLPAVAVGSTVSLQCESHPQDRFEGRIDFVADVVDPHSRTISARASIDNPEGELKPGMFVYAQIAGSGEGESGQVLAVPLSAVARIDDRDSLFVALEEGVFERREISLGRRWSEWVEVLGGLQADERVVVRGAFTLKSEALKGGLEGHHH